MRARSFYLIFSVVLLMIVMAVVGRADEKAPDPFGVLDSTMLTPTLIPSRPSPGKPAAPVALEEARRVSRHAAGA